MSLKASSIGLPAFLANIIILDFPPVALLYNSSRLALLDSPSFVIQVTPSQVTDGLSGLSGKVEGGIKLCPPPPPPQAESIVDKVNAATKDNLFISLSISDEYQIMAHYTKTNICDR